MRRHVCAALTYGVVAALQDGGAFVFVNTWVQTLRVPSFPRSPIAATLSFTPATIP